MLGGIRKVAKQVRYDGETEITSTGCPVLPCPALPLPLAITCWPSTRVPYECWIFSILWGSELVRGAR